MMVGAYSTLEGAQRTLMEALVASYLIKVGPTVRTTVAGSVHISYFYKQLYLEVEEKNSAWKNAFTEE